MATFLSDQLTNAAAKPAVMNAADHGRVERRYFSWTGDAAQNDLVQLCKVPAGARIMFGRIGYTAFGVSVTLDIGDGSTGNKYLSAADVSAAGASDFANTIALKGLGQDGQLSAEITLTAKLGGANPASGSLNGYIDYLLL
jgi:hypothetical protein